MQEDKIKAAITETLRPLEYCGKKFQAELAEKLYAAIAPHLESSPDWAEAPEWAEWAAQDSDGIWFFFEKIPVCGKDFWKPREIGNYDKVSDISKNWKKTLQRRPQ